LILRNVSARPESSAWIVFASVPAAGGAMARETH